MFQQIREIVLELFRKDFILNGLLLIPYCAILRIKSLIYPASLSPQAEFGVFNNWWVSYFAENPRLGGIVAILLISIFAYGVNMVSNMANVYQKKSLFPAVFFILICCLFDPHLTFLPVHIGVFFLLMAYGSITATFKKNEAPGSVFNAGLFLAIASLFYFPFIVFFFFGLIVFRIMKSFRWKDSIQYTIGYLIPYYLAFAALYFFNRHVEFYETYMVGNSSLQFLKVFKNREDLFIVGAVLLLIAFLVLQYSSFLSKKSMQTRKNVDILYWIILFSIPSVFFWTYLNLDHFIVLAFPTAILLAMLFIKIQNKFLAEVLHLIIIGCIFYSQFFMI